MQSDATTDAWEENSHTAARWLKSLNLLAKDKQQNFNGNDKMQNLTGNPAYSCQLLFYKPILKVQTFLIYMVKKFVKLVVENVKKVT